MRHSFKMTASALVMCAFASPLSAQETQVEVIHNLGVATMAPAVQLLISEFQSRCPSCEWVDTAIAGGSKARQTMANRAIGGEPAEVNYVHAKLVFGELVEAGLLAPVDPEGWEEWESHVAPALWTAMQNDDGPGIMWTPIIMNTHNVGFFSQAALDAVGMEAPQTIDEMFGFLAAVQEQTDTLPLAWAEVPITMFQIIQNLTAAVGGPELYNRIYVDMDPSAVDEPAYRQVAEYFKAFKPFTDEGRVGRVWQDASAMTARGDAAAYYGGTFAEDVFIEAGAVAGETLQCVNMNGVAVLGPNGWMYGRPDGKAGHEAQNIFAAMIMDPEVQAEYVRLAGGLPARNDVDLSVVTECMRQVSGAITDPNGKSVSDPAATMPQETQGRVIDAIVGYWADDGMTPDDFIASMKDALSR